MPRARSTSTRPLMGKLSRPDGEAERTGRNGDVVTIQLQVESGIVVEAAFDVQGCMVTLACAKAAAALARGLTLARIRREVTPETIIEVLDGVPENHEHCAELACQALHGAAEDAILGSREEWRKLYR